MFLAAEPPEIYCKLKVFPVKLHVLPPFLVNFWAPFDSLLTSLLKLDFFRISFSETQMRLKQKASICSSFNLKDVLVNNWDIRYVLLLALVIDSTHVWAFQSEFILKIWEVLSRYILPVLWHFLLAFRDI